MKSSYFAVIAVLFFVTGCSKVAVDTVHDPGTSFSKFKTYAWADISSPEDRLESYPEVKKMVHKSVDLVLRLKGFQLKESGDVDFRIATYAGIKQAMKLEKSGRVQDHSWLGPAGRYDYSKTGKATLFIDIFDGSSGGIIWRGSGVGFIRNYSRGEKMQKSINTWVAEILKSFPPR